MRQIIISVEEIDDAPYALREVAMLIERGYYSGFDPDWHIEKEEE